MLEYKTRYTNNDTKDKFKDLTPLQAKLLSSRLRLEEVDAFCNGEQAIKDMLKDKKLLEGSRLLKKHIDNNSSILIITDGDCDGISCAAVANLFFRKTLNKEIADIPSPDKDVSVLKDAEGKAIGEAINPMKKGEVKIIVNDRMFGNGVNIVQARLILNHKPDLIITADHGSADDRSFTLLKDLLIDIDILVTDHHIVPDNIIPTCDAFINPQDISSDLGKSLCGAAVLYLLFRAYSGKELEYLYPILGLATVVDQMGLNIGYNRYLYRQANKHLKNFLPFREYVRYVKHRYLWSTEFYSIGLGPLINSTKRMNTPIVGYNFLISDNKDEVFKHYSSMVKTNKSRKVQQTKVELSIEASLRKDRDDFKYSRVAITDIPNGVNGILAGRLSDSDHVPAFVFNKVGKLLSGSGRGHGDFDVEGLISAFRKTYKKVYISGGGHKGAGGLKLRADGFYLFRGMFERFGSRTETTTFEYYDSELPLNILGQKTFRKNIRFLQPYGRDFDYPIFKVRGVIKGYTNYGPSFFIYTILDNNGIKYKMMRFSELYTASFGVEVTLYVSPRGKRDYILLDVEV